MKIHKIVSLYSFNNSSKISFSVKTSSLIELACWTNWRLRLCWWNPNTVSYWLLPLLKKIRTGTVSLNSSPRLILIRVVKQYSCYSQRIGDRVRVCVCMCTCTSLHSTIKFLCTVSPVLANRVKSHNLQNCSPAFSPDIAFFFLLPFSFQKE